VEIEELFRQIVCEIFGVDADNSGDRIRFVWGSNIDVVSQSAPNLQTNKDVCFIQVMPEDNAYNQQRDIRYIDEGNENLTAVDEHTDVHDILFINYGANAYEYARAIRNGLHRDGVRRFLRLNKFALVTDIPAVRRVPELVNANWVNRVDVSATFNQFVRLVTDIGTIEQIGVTTVTEEGGGHKPTWPDGTQDVDEHGGNRRVGVSILQENGTITKTATIRKE